VMTVKELKNLLRDEDDDRIIMMSIDEEGNGFTRLHQVVRCLYDEAEKELREEKGKPASDTQYPILLLWPES
jgi:hypothetical protein